MTIVKQISLFDIQELLNLESSHRFDAIFATFDVQPIFYLFYKKMLRGAPRELNYGAMIPSLIIRIVERIPNKGFGQTFKKRSTISFRWWVSGIRFSAFGSLLFQYD